MNYQAVIDPKRNLVDELCPEGVSLQEFLAVLTSRFPSSVLETETNFVLYPKDPPHELRVEFCKDGVLSGIFALPALSQEKLDTIRQDIETEFIDSSTPGINRMVFFSFYPVRGWWRYRDRFQILPVPPHAPTVPFLYGDHPFVIEYKSSRTKSGLINTSRRVREASKMQLLLNAILIPGIRWISPRSVGTLSHHWTLTSNEPGNFKVEYLQEFYHYEDTAPLDSFSTLDATPRIPEVAPEAYYGERWIPTSEQLDLPSDLVLMLDQFFALDETLQDRFLNACYWLNHAHVTPSFSLMLLAAVQAIETLIKIPKGGKPCPTCGLIMGPGPTRLFKAFLDVFLPSFMKSKKGLRTLYNARSALTHGAGPLLADTWELHGALNPKDFDQRETVGEALRFARMCLRNWVNCEPFIHRHVAEAAYFLWQQQGFQNGRDKEHWFQAIADLRGLTFLDV